MMENGWGWIKRDRDDWRGDDDDDHRWHRWHRHDDDDDHRWHRRDDD